MKNKKYDAFTTLIRIGYHYGRSVVDVNRYIEDKGQEGYALINHQFNYFGNPQNCLDEEGTHILTFRKELVEDKPDTSKMETTEKDWHVPKIDMNKFQIGKEILKKFYKKV